MPTEDISKYVNHIIEGDCLDVLPCLPNHCIDMILCDLPYGTTQNKWDSVIDLDKLWGQYKRIIKPNGAIVLTSQGIFTAKLILSNEKWFKYKIVWIKSKATNFLNAKKQPLRKHEDICVFYNKQPSYNPQMGKGVSYDKGIRKDQHTGSYGGFNPTHVYSDGSRYPVDVIEFEEDKHDDFVYVKTAESEGEVFHATQKPVELGRYLVRTFSKPGDIVLDNACGCGSFLVSAYTEGRRFIGIEKNEDAVLHRDEGAIDFIEICKKRLKDEQAAKRKSLKTGVEQTPNVHSSIPIPQELIGPQEPTRASVGYSQQMELDLFSFVHDDFVIHYGRKEN